jgi:hypothetical protein
MAETHESKAGHLDGLNNEKRHKKDRKGFVRTELLNFAPDCGGKRHFASETWPYQCGHD